MMNGTDAHKWTTGEAAADIFRLIYQHNLSQSPIPTRDSNYYSNTCGINNKVIDYY